MPPRTVTAPRPPGATARPTTSAWRLRGYLRPYVTRLVIMLVCALVGVCMELGIPLVIGAIIDGPIRNHNEAGILWLGLLSLALGVTEAVVAMIRRWIQARAVLGVETAIRADLYQRLDELPLAFHSRWQSGQLLSRVTTDLSAIRRFSGFGMLFLVTNTLQLIVTVALLLHLYWPLGLVVAIAAVPIIYTSMTFEKRYVVISRNVQDRKGDVATQVEESSLGYRVIRSFGRRNHAFSTYDREAVRLYDGQMRQVKLTSLFFTFLEVLPNLALVVVLLLGALAVGHGQLLVGTLVAFVALMLSLVWPLESLGFILASAQEAMTASDRVLEILDSKPSIVGGDRTLADPRGRVTFDHVSFRFPDAERDTLHDVSFDLDPGETMALVGATGSGKTVLTNLVPRLYDVTGGRVLIDGVDVRDLTLESLRSVVAVAFEEPTLFSMSARENLTLGTPQATEDEIARAVAIAQAGFVYDLPWGLDTRIGEQGMSLSGGQRQRLALARAVLARPQVLVLDDTLSALDVHTEAKVEEALRSVLGRTTSIVVAHRASTVLLADRVALLQDGTITHVGQHSELMATVPAYHELLAAEAEETAVPAGRLEEVHQ